jgi:hypothetical protein
MKRKKYAIRILMLLLMLMLSEWTGNMNIEDINMSDTNSASAEISKSLKEAKNPTYSVGSQVVVKAHHKKGMIGAEATIVGAYDTIAYAVTYTPTTGGPTVKNHKWIIQEEIKNSGAKPIKPGTEVILEANHMEGMMGAKGTIDLAVCTTVHTIDYLPTTGGPIVKNNKWVIESELAAK